jgi:Spy/CpxP family protein refolding chaperone
MISGWGIAVCLCACLAASVAQAQKGPGGGAQPGRLGMGAPSGPPPGPPAGSPMGNAPSGAKPGAPPAGSTGGSSHGLPFGPVGRWWDDKGITKTIGLRTEQKKKMDVIFNANKPAILECYKTLLKEQAKLDALKKAPQMDKAAMFASIDAVSQARAALEKANTQMLLQIRDQMEAGQIVKLEQVK